MLTSLCGQVSTPTASFPLDTKYNKYKIVFATIELAALIFAPLHTKGEGCALTADRSALIAAAEAQIQTVFYIETLHAQMLLTKYTEAACRSESGQHVASQPNRLPKPVKRRKSVLIETLKPAGLSHVNLCKHLTVQASGRSHGIHSKF